jgi:hypothetical protein
MPGRRRQHAGDNPQCLGGWDVIFTVPGELATQNICDQAERPNLAQRRQAVETPHGMLRHSKF